MFDKLADWACEQMDSRGFATLPERRSLMDRVPDSMFVGHFKDIATFAGFCRETRVKLGY